VFFYTKQTALNIPEKSTSINTSLLKENHNSHMTHPAGVGVAVGEGVGVSEGVKVGEGVNV
jgi:hypothetical protein